MENVGEFVDHLSSLFNTRDHPIYRLLGTFEISKYSDTDHFVENLSSEWKVLSTRHDQVNGAFSRTLHFANFRGEMLDHSRVNIRSNYFRAESLGHSSGYSARSRAHLEDRGALVEKTHNVGEFSFRDCLASAFSPESCCFVGLRIKPCLTLSATVAHSGDPIAGIRTR